MSHITPSDIALWQQWIGRRETRQERLDVEALRRFAAATGADLNVESVMPSMAHWAWFLPVAAADALGVDGHPARGGFLPPIGLPRRMFAAADIRFDHDLILDEKAELVSTVVDVTHKAGRSGDLIFVKVERLLMQQGATCVTEIQTIVYRDAGGPTPAVVPLDRGGSDNQADQGEQAGAGAWTPRPVDLFRFSAATFNSHRIHYDGPYASAEEGYPGLVVHGPLIATKLHAFMAARHQGPIKYFAFRANAPAFVSQPISLMADEALGAVGGATQGQAPTPAQAQAVRCDGVVAMQATAQF